MNNEVDGMLKIPELTNYTHTLIKTTTKNQQKTTLNPYTAPTSKNSGLKSAHIHACRQYI